MAWDEWEEIKADVAVGRPTGMQLNQVPVDPALSTSAVTGGLKSSKKAWVTAGEGIGSLRKGISSALVRLEDGQSGLGANPGCPSAAAQREVYDSWKRYVEDLSERCDSLQRILGQVGHDQLMTDEAVNAAFHTLQLTYADTDAVGGQAKGH
ncbi:hypothetical protein PZB75_11450 [Streptomyces sp. AM 4-1-1]|uniref:hypothetical protein n=1 Tax=Streptomyces sp. AM 4-1-1 TaxID=3028710 RepID=UPI0023BA0876|nr:hypothetical protein [Streptomyces sp. AM 4-1-1]WEH33930.1 hypothetical protein PZB75_11450 [Streptomyces sp. AM 4-1-1]